MACGPTMASWHIADCTDQFNELCDPSRAMKLNPMTFTGVIEKDKLLQLLPTIDIRMIDAWSCWDLPYGEHLENDVNTDEGEAKKLRSNDLPWFKPLGPAMPDVLYFSISRAYTFLFLLKSIWVRFLTQFLLSCNNNNILVYFFTLKV